MNLTNFVIFSNFKIQIWQVTKSIDSITHITFCCKSIHMIFSCCVVHKNFIIRFLNNSPLQAAFGFTKFMEMFPANQAIPTSVRVLSTTLPLHCSQSLGVHSDSPVLWVAVASRKAVESCQLIRRKMYR